MILILVHHKVKPFADNYLATSWLREYYRSIKGTPDAAAPSPVTVHLVEDLKMLASKTFSLCDSNYYQLIDFVSDLK